MNKFFTMISDRWEAGKRVCLGLDSDPLRLPEVFRRKEPLQAYFNSKIVDRTHASILCYKFNIAFYQGGYGMEQLRRSIAYIHEVAPNVPVILDAKYGDVGNTNRGYVVQAFDYLDADAITVNPYPGKEAMLPFLEQWDKGVIVLCRTSNPGSDEFQTRLTEATEYHELTGREFIPFYLLIALQIAHQWNEFENCGLVVGAPYPKEMAEVRRFVGGLHILAPGTGTQGANVEQTVRAGIDATDRGLIISSSHDIIFASSGPDFAEAAYRKTIELTNQTDHALDLLV